MYIYAAVLIAGLVAGFAGGWTTNGWRHGAILHAQQVAERRDTLKRMERIDEAAVNHEDFKANEEVRYVERVKVVRQLVDRPIYRNVCLDRDGLRLLNDAIEGRPTTGELAPTVPESPAAR